jgi:hypothetical protein
VHTQNCTKARGLHDVLYFTLGAYALVVGCVSMSASLQLRRLKQQREAAALDANVKSADV